jgi:hypothetical protein
MSHSMKHVHRGFGSVRPYQCGGARKEEILLPFWRGLRQLQSFSATEPHWPEVRYSTLERLGEQLRARRS